MRLLWAHNSQEEEWGFLFVDAWKYLNEENWIAIFWAVWHEWSNGAHFTFNFYRHGATLVVRDTEDGSGHLLHSKENVTQGDSLAMISYGIGVIPLIREIRDAHHRFTHPHEQVKTSLTCS